MTEFICNEFTYLLPGELIVSDEALKISTILGSCVSVCLYDQNLKIAGMNHYMLPYNKSIDTHRNRYGDTSLEDMLKEILRIGARMNKIVSRVYGGSSIFNNTSAGFNVGERNVEVAMQFLKNYNIATKTVDTGGRIGRKVVFDTSAGLISCNFLKETLKK